MISLRNLKMRKKDLTLEEVRNFRQELNDKLYDKIRSFDKAKRRAQELSHLTYLD
jgi:hypothetical protein